VALKGEMEVGWVSGESSVEAAVFAIFVFV
jgi:hypothetical protein